MVERQEFRESENPVVNTSGYQSVLSYNNLPSLFAARSFATVAVIVT